MSFICHYALENCRVEMIESNYFIKLDVCGLSVRFRGIQMKTTWNSLSLNTKNEKKKKLLVEWKIGTFGVYNLTTTTREKPQAKNRGPKIVGVRASCCLSFSPGRNDMLNNSCTLVSRSYGAAHNHWSEQNAKMKAEEGKL